MKRKIVVTLSCDSDDPLEWLKKDIEREISCCSTFFEVEDVRPVVRGKWDEERPDSLDGDSIYVCSVCGETWDLEAGTPKDNNMNFCPNCGADMRQEKEEEP